MTITVNSSEENFSVGEQGNLSRRDLLIMSALAAGSAVVAVPGAKAALTGGTTSEPYVARDFTGLVTKKMDGISVNQIEQHLKLYQGYIKKANEIYTKLQDVDIASANATYSPLRELLMEQSYAVNGAIYHEYYFGNLGGKDAEPQGELRAALEERWGSMNKFMDFLKASGKSMRGWVVIGYNTRAGHLDAFGLDTHNMWSPVNTTPIVVLDVYEHAYMIDYGIDRAKYLEAFVKNLDWEVVGKRLAAVRTLPTGLDTTI
jgi:Fe-Mn family superoxide dismutase